nr:alkaline phosphatase family protein [Candidatus Dependentiae bacterium]
MSDSKNLIIGLDGVPYELIKKYTDNGVMPFVKSIIDKGIFRAMNSSLPAVSSTAWTSFFTGQNPAVHNVYGFYDLSEDFQLKFNLYDANRGIPVWTKLKNENKRTMALNIP